MVKRDKNGNGVYFSNNVIKLGAFVLTVIVALASFVGYVVGIQNDLAHLENTVAANAERNAQVEEISRQNRQDIAVMKGQIEEINRNTQQIKKLLEQQ